MDLVPSLMTGTLFSVGVYLMMSGSLFRLVLGLSILSQGANLLVFGSGGLVRGRVPFISESLPTGGGAEPLSQALILTAIVIGFAMTAFLVVLARQTYVVWKTDDVDSMTEEEM